MLSASQGVVISAGHGNLHLMEAAIAADRAGILQAYLTSLYMTDLVSGVAYSGIGARVLSASQRAKLLQRHRPELDSSKVKAYLGQEVWYRLLNGMQAPLGGLWAGYRDQAYLAPMLAFGWATRHRVSSARVFHVRSGYGRFAIANARRSGASILVDHSIADSSVLTALYAQEAGTDKASRPLLTSRAFAAIDADLKDADVVLVNSEYVRDTLVAVRRASPDRIRVLRLGVDAETFYPESTPGSDGTFTILFAGSIDQRKGIHYLLEAFRQLNLLDAQLVIAGPQGNVSIDARDPRIKYAGALSRQELARLFRRANAFVFPTLAEGSARVVMEAMASGLAVITTAEAGSPVRDGREGIVVGKRDTRALTVAIRTLYENRALCKRLGDSGRRLVLASYTWENYRRELVSLYLSLDKGESRGSPIRTAKRERSF